MLLANTSPEPTRWPRGKATGRGAGRSGVRIPGIGKFSLRTTAVDARVNYPLNLFLPRRYIA